MKINTKLPCVKEKKNGSQSTIRGKKNTEENH